MNKDNTTKKEYVSAVQSEMIKLLTAEDSRYPYTYACDFIRSYGGYKSGSTNISRSDASQIRSAIAMALGMEDDLLSAKLADYYKANTDVISDKAAKEATQSLQERR